MNYEESPISKMVEKALNEAFEKDQNFKITKSELKKLVKEALLEEAIAQKTKEVQKIDEAIQHIDEDEVPHEYQDFDAVDFKTTAKSAAAQDIEDYFGEPMDDISDEEEESLSGDLERANLRLPSDEEELQKLKNILAKKAAAKKSMGAFSLNEGEIPTLGDSMISLDEEEQEILQSLLKQRSDVKIANRPKSSLFFKDLDFMNESSNKRMMKLTGLLKESFEGEHIFENDEYPKDVIKKATDADGHRYVIREKDGSYKIFELSAGSGYYEQYSHGTFSDKGKAFEVLDKITKEKSNNISENDEEVDPIAWAKTSGLNGVDWEAEGLEYAGDDWYGLSAEEKEEIISDLKRNWHS